MSNASRSRLLRAVSVAAWACAAAPAAAGTVYGRVELVDKRGRPDPGVSDVFVYLDGVAAPPRPTRAQVRMKGKEFRPHVVMVGRGSTVEFPNDDGIFHNVFSVSGPNRFDLDLYKRPKTGAWTFAHAGVVRVYCNIHPQMSAIVLVRDNPYFTRASAAGAYALDGVPAGRYDLRAWHERGGETGAFVDVPAEGSVEAPALRLDTAAYRRVQHRNKFGKPYATREKY